MHFFSFVTLNCSTLIRNHQLENLSREKLEKKMFLKNVGNQSGRLVGDKI